MPHRSLDLSRNQPLGEASAESGADSGAELERRRYRLIAEAERRATAERLGFLAHELRNFLNTAMLSFAAIRSGSVAVNGATSAVLEAGARGCALVVTPIQPDLAVEADRQGLQSAVSNLVQNAFKFTRPGTEVSLRAYESGERVLIEVEDRCGGLPEGKAEALFGLFEQHHADRSGLGLGLTLSRRAVETSGGVLRVRDLPGCGCVFTIDMPAPRGAAH